MLHIFLTILKIPFILLAVLLLLLLTAVLLLLFVPVRYQASAEKTEKLTASARVTWLLHLLSIHVSYLEGKPQISVKLCGYTVIGQKKKSSESSKKDRPAMPEQAEPSEVPEQTESSAEPESESMSEQTETFAETEKEPMPEQTESFAETESEPIEEKAEPSAVPEQMETSAEPESEPIEEQAESSAVPEKEPVPEQPRVSIFDRVRLFFEKIKNSFRLFLEKIRNIRESFEKLKTKLEYYKKLWYDVHTQEALRHVKKEIRYLLRHYFPGKIEGNVLFGLDDPAATGQLLGILSILQVAAGNHVIVEADFTRTVLEGRISMKGHIRACHAVKTALALLLDAHIRITIKRVRKLLKR